MKDFLITFRFLLKQSLSFKFILNKMKEDKKYRNTLSIIIIVILLCLPSYVMIINGLTNMYKTLKTIHFDSLFIIMALMLSIGLIIIFGIFQIMGYLYFSKDVKILTPYPIKPRNYLLSKFFVIYVWEFIISIFTVLPFFIIYGVYNHLFITNWIIMLLNFILLPIIPLVLIGLITVLLMRFTNLFKSRDAVRFIGYSLLIVVLLGFQFYFLKTAMNIPTDPTLQREYINKIFGNSSFFLDQFSKFYPVTDLIKYGMTGTFIQAVLSFLALFIVSVVLVYLFGLLLQAIFLPTYLKDQNNTQIKKRKNQDLTSISYNKNSIVKGIAKIDFITILKVPMFALNCLGIGIIFPVILIAFTVFFPSSHINQLLGYYYDNRFSFWFFVTLALTVISALHPIASTTFSREGKTNWIMRTLPIKAKDHIKGRSIVPFFINLEIDILLVGIIIYRLGSQNIGNNIAFGIISIIISLIGAIGISFIGLYIDLKHPMLSWENPQQAVKQNLNVLLSFAIGILYGVIIFMIYKIINSIFGPLLSNYELYGIYSLVLLVLNGFLAYITYDILKRQFIRSLIVME